MPSEGVPPEKERVVAWLEYFSDLRIGGFYRNRGAGKSAAAAAKRFAAAAPRPVPVNEPSRTPAAPTKSQISAMTSPPQAAAAQSTSKVTVLPVAHGPSLFEAFERVPNETLERIRADIGDCTRCRLCEQRNKIVFGVGNPKADIVFVGEGPGRDEDAQGEPFVGRAGKLLTDMIKAMSLERSDVYIANVVKCRPPENRTPEHDEIATCSPFLLRQLECIRPKVVVCLGNVAAQSLLGTNKSISHFRGQWFDFRGSRLIATYHPAYLLRNPAAKSDVWTDLKKVMAVLGLKAARLPKR
ncbi:MAG: uracil-DNA glycosylase [Candidatus Acidiferrales bacterium]